MEEKKNPAGPMIDAGRIELAGSGIVAPVDTGQQGRIETRQRSVEEYIAELATGSLDSILPPPMGAIIADCARAGVRHGVGRGGIRLSQADKLIRETVMREAPALREKYRAEAKAARKTRGWARVQTAEALRQRMLELGATRLPAPETIMKWKF